MATGTSAGPLWKNSARIYVLLPRNAGQTGTSQRPNSRRRGSKAARTSSIRTAKPTPKLSVNRIRGQPLRSDVERLAAALRALEVSCRSHPRDEGELTLCDGWPSACFVSVLPLAPWWRVSSRRANPHSSLTPHPHALRGHRLRFRGFDDARRLSVQNGERPGLDCGGHAKRHRSGEYGRQWHDCRIG